MMLLVLQQELNSLQWDIQHKDFDHADWHIKDLLQRVTKELKDMELRADEDPELDS